MTTEEFTRIYHEHAQKVFRLCLGYASGDEDLAKDWQQETFIKVWKHRKTFKGQSALSTWIFRIAVNICLSDLRRIKKRSQLNDKFLKVEPLHDEEDNTEIPIKQLYRCINQLTQNNKTIILMELEAVPQAIIAETLGISHGSIRTRLNRIRTTLLKCISNENR